MKKEMKVLSSLLLACSFNSIYSQENIIDSLIQNNYNVFRPINSKQTFAGEGWHLLLKQVNNANSVLIGETHFTNEVPYFTNAIIDAVKFDNYFHEIDPYTNKIIESKIKSFSSANLDEFLKKYNSTFSFLEIEKDFKLYKKIVRNGIRTFGVEQISLYSDRLIVSTLNENSKNHKAKEIYSRMINNSKELALRDKKKRYLFSDDCRAKIDSLLKLELSVDERKQIEALKLSRNIYLDGNHHLRIQLMKNILIQEMPNWVNKKNLFKFGAFHTPKGESLMEIFDIGNLVNNIEDGNFRNSLHVMIVGKNENEQIDNSKMYVSFLKVIKNDDWYCFDLRPLHKAISENRLKIENQMLLRIVKGNDYLIYVPKFTESKNVYYKP